MRPEETRDRILDATDQLLGKLGFDTTTTDDLLAIRFDGYYERLTAALGKRAGVDPFSLAALEARKRHVRQVVALLFRELRGTPNRRTRGKTWARSIRRTPRRSSGS